MAMNLTNPLLKWIALFFIGLLGVFTLIIHHFSNAAKQSATASSSFVHDSATSDTSVETLKTLTAEITAVEQQNRALAEQNKMLTDQDKTLLANVKSEVLAEVQQQITQTQANNAQTALTKNTIDTNPTQTAQENPTTMNGSSSSWTWVGEIEQLSPDTALASKTSSTDVGAFLTNEGSNEPRPSTELSVTTPLTEKVKKPVSPYYTLPVNATLTGAIAMMPIIGRIPIEGKVPDPYPFKVIIGPHNLAANGVDIPSDVQGIVASGVAEGDLLGRCARGDIESMTFVFQDGRISTTEAKSGEALGTIAAANGNPCLAGSFHTDAPLFLGVTTGLASVQGYGNALSQAQLNHVTTDSGASIANLIGSSNKYAFGQGFSAASQAAQQWWNQRVSSSFDFIYVPNVDVKTGQLLKLNINITQEIPIDYNPEGRKVFYAHDSDSSIHSALD